MADAPEAPARHMKFPYTFSAKIAQFPYKFYFNNNWIAKYYVIGLIVCIPVFKSISNLGEFYIIAGPYQSQNVFIAFCSISANSPENVAKWAEIRRREAAEHH